MTTPTPIVAESDSADVIRETQKSQTDCNKNTDHEKSALESEVKTESGGFMANGAPKEIEGAEGVPVAEKGKEKDEQQYLSGWKLNVMSLNLTIIAFIMTLNASVVATAIPSISTTFHSVNDIGWYGAAYLLSNCACQPLSGKIYSLFSTKITFLTFLVTFEVGSLLSGVARSSDMLIVGRSITGIGGSGLVGGAFVILAAICPLDKRPRFIGIVSGVGAVGQIVGPLIGGALTDHLSWRWCFYLNLPTGAAAFFFFFFLRIPDSIALVKPKSWREIPDRLDLIGFALFALSIVMTLLAFQWAGNTYSWSSSVIIGLLVGGLTCLIVFGIWAHRRGEKALIPISVVRQRIVYCACVGAVFVQGGLSLLSFYMPTWFQLVKEVSATQSGINVLPQFASQIFAAVFSGFATSRIGYYIPFAIAGTVLTLIGSSLFTTFHPNTGIVRWAAYQVLTGLGRGMSLQQYVTAVQANTSKKMLPIVSSLVPFCQYFGSALFVSLGTTVFTNRLTPALAKYAPDVNTEVVIEAGATGIRDLVSSEDLSGVLLAANQALTQTFFLAVGASVVAFFASWGLGWTYIKKDKKKSDIETPSAEISQDKAAS